MKTKLEKLYEEREAIQQKIIDASRITCGATELNVWKNRHAEVVKLIYEVGIYTLPRFSESEYKTIITAADYGELLDQIAILMEDLAELYTKLKEENDAEQQGQGEEI